MHFYNNTKGFVPTRVLIKQGVVDVEDAYRVGQLLRCVVLLNLKGAGEEATVLSSGCLN